jgi:hypothetical protein
MWRHYDFQCSTIGRCTGSDALPFRPHYSITYSPVTNYANQFASQNWSGLGNITRVQKENTWTTSHCSDNSAFDSGWSVRGTILSLEFLRENSSKLQSREKKSLSTAKEYRPLNVVPSSWFLIYLFLGQHKFLLLAEVYWYTNLGMRVSSITKKCRVLLLSQSTVTLLVYIQLLSYSLICRTAI